MNRIKLLLKTIALGQLTSLLCTVVLIAACAPPNVTATLTVRTEPGTLEQLGRTAENLTARFDEVLPTFRSTVSSSVAGNTMGRFCDQTGGWCINNTGNIGLGQLR